MSKYPDATREGDVPVCEYRFGDNEAGPGWICTRPPGHEGEHVAGGPSGQVYATELRDPDQDVIAYRQRRLESDRLVTSIPAWADLRESTRRAWRDMYRERAYVEETGDGAMSSEAARDAMEVERKEWTRVQEYYEAKNLSRPWRFLPLDRREAQREYYRRSVHGDKLVPDAIRDAEENKPSILADILSHDPVKAPSHYLALGATCPGCERPIECIDVVQHMNFPVGNAVKYLWRLDFKDEPIQELRKAIQNIEFEIERRKAADDA